MKPRIFYGWWVIAAVVLALMISSGTGFYCFGVFMDPVREDFGWTKAQVTWIITVYWIVSGFSAPIVGKLIDAHGVRKVMLFTAMLNGACLLALSSVNTLWQFYVAYGLKAVAHAGIGLMAIGSIVSKWFIKKRGRATGFATTGIGLGGLFLAPLAGFLIPISGWRSVYVILGILLLILVIPAIAFVIRSSPEEMGLLPDGEEKQAGTPSPTMEVDEPEPPTAVPSGLTFSQALQTPTYWLLVAVFFLVPAAVFGTLAHQTSYIEGIGISRETASLALGFTAGVGILGKIFFGFLAERIQVRYAATLCFGIQAVGVLILMMTGSMGMVWVFVLVYGFSMGGMATLQPLLVMDFFGTAAVGAILGSISFVFALGAASGPLCAAYIYDFLQSYYWAFLIYIASYVCASIMIFVSPVVQKPLSPLSNLDNQLFATDFTDQQR
jgi:sugar phosphate permease